jgi:hypothetical protein
MWVERRRKKKLTVAFHFLLGGQAGWKCDACRRQGLEAARRCGWIGEDRRAARSIVWARGRATSEECPTSFVTPQSNEWVETFLAWRAGGAGDLLGRGAREAEAFLLLEEELRKSGGRGSGDGVSGDKIEQSIR